jgi:hypothetical protein
MSNSNSLSEVSVVKEVTQNILSAGLKKFPDDFLNDIKCFEELVPNKILVLTSEFFGHYEIKTSDGEVFKMVDNLYLAKYYIYSSAQRKSTIKIPVDESELKKVVKDYEKYFDEIVRTIDRLIEKLGGDTNKLKLTNEIINSLNMIRFQ